MIYEYRRYSVTSGRMADMHARFATINRPLFEKYGIELKNVWRKAQHLRVVDGAAVDQAPTADEFHFLVAFADLPARERAWQQYHADPLFIAAREEQSAIMKVEELIVFEEESQA